VCARLCALISGYMLILFIYRRIGLTSPETVDNYQGTKDVFSFSRWRVVAGLFHLNTFLIWLTSHSLSGDSKKILFSILWTDSGNFANTSSSWALAWRVFGTAHTLARTHTTLVAVLAILLCLIFCNINWTRDSKFTSYKWGLIFNGYVCITVCSWPLLHANASFLSQH
jgi:hypothetical protein